MKGLRKGFKYFGRMFDEEKEQEIQIGFPTDVKHVAHIGWDGPAPVESPSWMKDFGGEGGRYQSAPLGRNGAPLEDKKPEIKWVSEDGKRSRRKDQPELPKSSKRPSSSSNSVSGESPIRESSSRTKQSKKHQSKDSSDSLKGSLDYEQSSRNLPDIPKKSKKKRSKDSIGNNATSKSSRSKGSASKSIDDVSQSNSLDYTMQDELKGLV